MERGFYHPSHGYWQTTGEVPMSIRNSYPAGTIEVPIKPGADFDFVDGAWVEVAHAPPPVPASITRRQAAYALWQSGALVGRVIITGEEALAMARDATIPAPFLNILNGCIPGTEIPMFTQAQKIAFGLDFSAMEYFRASPLIGILAYALDLSDAEIDSLFRLGETFN